MTEIEAIDKAKAILNLGDELTKKDIDAFYRLESFITDYKFGDLVEALFASAPSDVLQYL